MLFFKKKLQISCLFLALSFCEISYCSDNCCRQQLSEYIQKGQLMHVKALMEKEEIDIESPSQKEEDSPLIEAAQSGHVSVMQYLLEHGAFQEGISKKERTALTEVIKVYRKKISPIKLLEAVSLLLDHGADVNAVGENKYTPLMEASIHTQSEELIRYLIERGADVNYLAKDGMTALILALRNNNVKAFNALADQGAQIDIFENYTPMGYLAYDGNVRMMDVLMQRFPLDMNEVDGVGQTPLIIAAYAGKVPMVRYLVERGADVTMQTASTIYMKIPEAGQFSILKRYKIVPTGSTALTFARHFGGKLITNALIELGAVEYHPVEKLEEMTSFPF